MGNYRRRRDGSLACFDLNEAFYVASLGELVPGYLSRADRETGLSLPTWSWWKDGVKGACLSGAYCSVAVVLAYV